MSRRLRRNLIRLFVVLAVLTAIGLAVFTWLAYWPLESDVEDVKGLVPANVDFVYRGSWEGLKDTGWLQENVLEHPVVPQVRDQLSNVHAILDQIRDAEEQINSQIPLGITTFSVEDDLLGGELLAAGKFCEDWDPKRGPPTWREVLVFLEVSWKPKFFASLKHSFIRDQVAAGMNATIEDKDDGLFEFLFHNVPAGSLAERSTCGNGTVVPPRNVWYGLRVRNVLVFGNSLSLMRDVQQLARDPDEQSYLSRPWVSLDAPPNAIAASMDLHPLRRYLIRAVEMAGPPISILKRYLTLDSLDRTNGRLVLPNPDLVLAEAEIRYQSTRLHPGVQSVYDLPPQELGADVAPLVPGEDTFGALLLRTPPLHLIEAIFNEVLSDGDRKLWNDNVRRIGGYDNIDEFFAEFASKLSDTAGIALGRMGAVFDRIDYSAFDTGTDVPDPNWPALAMMVRLNSSTKPDELDAFLADRVPALGGSKELEKKTYRGFHYTRIHLEVQSPDYRIIQPAYMLAQNHFIFSSNESYFLKILDTMADPVAHPPLSADPTYRATMAHLHDSGHLAFFLDMDKLLRVPSAVGPGAMPRGYLWDRRNIWVNLQRQARGAAIDYRTKLQKEYTLRTGRPATEQQQMAIEDRVSEFVTRWRERYPEFEEEYREMLAGYRRARALGLSIQGVKPMLHLRFALLLQSAGDEAGP